MAAAVIESQQQSPEEDLGHVISVCWEKGKVAAAYYSLSTLELFVSHETLDFSPEFAVTMNLMRQIKPLHIIASGPNYFLKELLSFCNYPSDVDLGQYRVNNLRMACLQPFVIYRQNEKNLNLKRKRILEASLPGIPETFSAEDRIAYVESTFPLHQQLVVHSLGALLEYTNVNRAHLFLGPGTEVVINDLKVYKLSTEVLIDDFTFTSLQIFSESNHHPSGYKKGENQTIKEGFSIFRLFDRCLSRLGSKTMKMMLAHPIRNTNELSARYETIGWYLSAKSSERMALIKKYLKNIGDISQVLRNIIIQPDKLMNWFLFKKIIYNAYMVMKGCKDIAAEVPANTLFANIAASIEDDEYILQVLHVLDRVVDLDKSLSHSKFSVQMGLDGALDEKKLLMISVQDSIQQAVEHELRELTSYAGDIYCYYIPECGYVIRVDCCEDEPSILDQLNQHLTLVAQTNGAYFFQNSLCNELNEKYGNLFFEIREHETRICLRLISFLKERLVTIQSIVKLCAQLDCVLSFAHAADQMSLRKPEIIPEKSLDIQQGRHILWELRQRMVPNDFTINNSENRKLVTLLSAPNSSGKSVFLKQVALTAFLAHIGSFVPASGVRLGVIDSIYSRINCPESVHGNNSSFLSDVRQLGKVMANSSDRSLILIDEFGKGTSPLEAQALLASCIEDLVKRADKCPITLISTHYADVYDIIDDSAKDAIAMKTFENITTKNNEMISTFRLKAGWSMRKYAMKVASAKKLIEDIDRRLGRSKTGASFLIELKIRLAVQMVWMVVHDKPIDYRKLMERLISLDAIG